MRVALDIQHAGKPRSPRDRGAQLGTVTEVWATRRLALACEEALDAAGHEVYAIRDGEYRDRHQRVNALRPDVYVSWHLDAGIGGRGDRGAVFHWPGSTKGSATAARIVAACQPIVPWPLTVKPAEAGEWDRVRACLAGVQAPAVLLELGFCDGLMGRQWLQNSANLEALGAAVARGLA